jgi:hypothetical protein
VHCKKIYIPLSSNYFPHCYDIESDSYIQ